MPDILFPFKSTEVRQDTCDKLLSMYESPRGGSKQSVKLTLRKDVELKRTFDNISHVSLVKLKPDRSRDDKLKQRVCFT